MGANDRVDGSLFQTIKNGFALRRCAETVEQRHLDRIGRKSL